MALVKYIGPLGIVFVPSVGKLCQKGNSIEVPAEVATSLLAELGIWEAGDKETEELVPHTPAALLQISGYLNVYESSRGYPAGVLVEEGGATYLALVPSTGEAPASHPSAWRRIASAGVVINAASYGAKGDGVNDDGPAINEASAVAASLGGGEVVLPRTIVDVYLTKSSIIERSKVTIRGMGSGVTTIKLAAAANVAVVQSENFAALLGTGEAEWNVAGKGIQYCALEHLTIDGNRSGNAPGAGSINGNGINRYGRCHRLHDVIVRNCANDGIRTQDGVAPALGSQTDSVECRFTQIKIHDTGRHGWWHQGPSDCQINDVIIWRDNLNNEKGIGFWAENDNVTNASGTSNFTANGVQITNMHCFGSAWGMVFDTTASCVNCHSEGATVGQVLVRQTLNWYGGSSYLIASTNTITGLGIQVGDDGATTTVPTTKAITANVDIRTRIQGFLGITESTAAIRWVAGNQSKVDALCPMRDAVTGMTVAAESNEQAANALTEGRLHLNEVPEKLREAGQVAVIRAGVIIAVIAYTSYNKAEKRLQGCTSTSAEKIKTGDEVKSYNQALWGAPDAASDIRVIPAGTGMTSAVQLATGYAKFITSGPRPGLELKSNLGSTATGSIEGTDSAGKITATPSGSGIVAGTELRVTYSQTRSKKGHVQVTPASEEATKVGFYVFEEGQTGFSIRVVTAPTTGKELAFNYAVFE